ncbi:MAG TPA: hypothetical protein VN778_01260 [Verrucomicrobiae bacterium]|nr:hypothetical protein [Verrucomicrobiae bacterium]
MEPKPAPPPEAENPTPASPAPIMDVAPPPQAENGDAPAQQFRLPKKLNLKLKNQMKKPLNRRLNPSHPGNTATASA